MQTFSEKYENQFLSRDESNFGELLDKISVFHSKTKSCLGDGKVSRRKIKKRFNYAEELQTVEVCQQGIGTEEIASEINDMLEGCMRHQNPTTAFNMIPAPLLDTVAGVTLMSLYNTNTCWDFISGKLGLYEKKIVRMLGKLVNWHEADGYVVTGGKQALAYAVKNGIGRVDKHDACPISNLVVICSKLAHYSIEHVCHYLGISPENCIRVDVLPTGEMDPDELKSVLERVHKEDKKVATVIAVGGATINLIPDSILDIRQTIDRFVEEHGLEYAPHLHVDTVISWAWLGFEQKHIDSIQSKYPRILEKLNHVVSKLQWIESADSFAADFHKTGFCPYAAGVYIAKSSEHLMGMAIDGSTPSLDIFFGESEIYRYTFENSRSSLGIAAIWIALRRMGIEGIREFILYQLEVSERFKEKIRSEYMDDLEVLNEHTNGWEIVLKPHFYPSKKWDHFLNASLDEKESYSKSCHAFLNQLWFAGMNGQNHVAPILGFVKKYSRNSSYEEGLPAFLIHPTSLDYTEETISEMLEGLILTKRRFEKENVDLEVGDDYLANLVPPR